MSIHNTASASRLHIAGGSPEIPVRVSSVQNLKKRKAPGSVSGRAVSNLTQEQLAKKRANDREAQRAIRERTKNQIELLERRIEELQSQDAYQELRKVQQQKEGVEEELSHIKTQLSSILSSLQSVVAQGSKENPRSVPAYEAVRSQRLPVSFQPPHCEAAHGATNLGDSPSTTSSIPDPSANRQWLRSGDIQPDLQNWSPSDPFEEQREALQSGLDLEESGERLGFSFLLDENQSLLPSDRTDLQPPQQSRIDRSGKRSKGMPAFTTLPRTLGATCPLDGILLDFLAERQHREAEGYSSSRLVGPAYPSVSSLLNPERSKFSHPLSKVFTDILSTFPDLKHLPEQVAVLYIMFLVMRWQIAPTQENYERLPDWITPRPSQLFTAHPAWMDYLPWPRMRDRIIQHHASYPFDSFFIPYTVTLCLNWPYEPTDCLLSASESEDLQINPVFERHLRNLLNWSLGPAFAKAFPDLAAVARIKDDVPIR
ncbi:hypothetical protein EV356DRAFT_528498 [Viridothelium virens]|uniref:BZIP transcription factor n=1 Tax=Viridothelium virens TaxID=1048519 RepID=A0A6A6HMJ3_VIRVR|nr:hypothetical protein EV356DRAFT_528498 [Viridothelium virens]